MGSFFRGLFLLLARPRLWGYVWKPLGWAALAYFLILVLGQWLLLPRIAGWIPGSGWLDWTITVGAGIAVTAVWFFAANVLFLAIAALFSSFLWERLSLEVEQEIYGDAPQAKAGCFAIALDTLLRLVFAAAVVVVSMMLGWLGVAAAALAAGLLALIDCSASAYIRRGIFFPAQLKVLGAKNAVGFFVLCAVVSLLPFVFVLLLPGIVAGATILCREAEPTQRSGDSGSV